MTRPTSPSKTAAVGALVAAIIGAGQTAPCVVCGTIRHRSDLQPVRDTDEADTAALECRDVLECAATVREAAERLDRGAILDGMVEAAEDAGMYEATEGAPRRTR